MGGVFCCYEDRHLYNDVRMGPTPQPLMNSKNNILKLSKPTILNQSLTNDPILNVRHCLLREHV
jgi:hypothetical protein